jgi:hypothetical protein
MDTHQTDVFDSRYTFTEKEVSKYQPLIQSIIPELTKSQVRHIAEYCLVYCDTIEENAIYESIINFYETFNKPLP